jgi:predicted alpha/beta-hydrolase family hydrolase
LNDTEVTETAKQSTPLRRRAAARPPVEAERQWLVTGDADARTHLILAHGAGAPMGSPFLTSMVGMIAAKGVTVHRFDFPYMATRANGGPRRPPPRAETLVSDYCHAFAQCRARIGEQSRLLIGGKSMGGRVACLAAADLAGAHSIAGVVVIGYPLAPARRSVGNRGRTIQQLAIPTLIVQGTRDPFGGPSAFEALNLPETVHMHWIEDGDHDLKPRRSTGLTHVAALEEAAQAIAEFCERAEC